MELFQSKDFDAHEQVVFASDPKHGFKAIIAVHNTRLGPAIGGCRIRKYEDEAEAVTDVLRLSRGMSYKAAVAGVPFGGGKMVVIADPHTEKTPELLYFIGRTVERLGGRYKTGEDVGTTVADMVAIRTETTHVMGLPEDMGGSGDPSPSTALGVFVGIEAAARHRLGVDTLSGLTVAVQGLGNVGMNLCTLLAEAGAQLIVADTRAERVQEAETRFGAKVSTVDDIYSANASIFAPCALGAVMNDETLAVLKAKVIAGAANNQLARESIHGEALRQKGILYAPDYVINGGGMIQLAYEVAGFDRNEIEPRVRQIAITLQEIFERADAQGVPTHIAAEAIANERLANA